MDDPEGCAMTEDDDHVRQWRVIESRRLRGVEPPTAVRVEMCGVCSRRRDIEHPL